MPTTRGAGADRDRRVSERSLHVSLRWRPGAFVGVDLRRRVVGAVLDEDAVGVERRVARGRRPVPLAHDRRAVLEQRRAGRRRGATRTVCLPSVTSKFTPFVVSCDRCRSTTPPARRKRDVPSSLAVVHRLGDGPEVDDVLGQHDREHDDRDDRDDAAADRDDVPRRAAGGRRSAVRAPGRRGDRRHSLAVATAPRASCAARSSSQYAAEHDDREHPAGDDVLGDSSRCSRRSRAARRDPLGDRLLDLALLAVLLEREQAVAPVEEVARRAA